MFGTIQSRSSLFLSGPANFFHFRLARIFALVSIVSGRNHAVILFLGVAFFRRFAGGG